MNTKPKAPLLRTLRCSIGTAFLAGTLFSPVSLVAEDEFRSDDTDIYGNRIYTNSAGTVAYRFLVDGESQAVLSSAGCGLLVSDDSPLDALCKSVCTTAGGPLNSTKAGIVILFR